jgi:DNA-directed RNA polymerase specialized sigma24 family protein
MSISDDANRLQSVRAVDKLLAVYDWQLIDHQAFVEATHNAWLDSPTTDLSYLAFGIYNNVLYHACVGMHGLAAWERAYAELFTMLAARAKAAYPDIWDDAVQAALVQICSSIERCKEPRAFFLFAWGYVQNAARSMRPGLHQKQYGSDLSLEPDISGIRPLVDQVTDGSPGTEDLVLANERLHEIRSRVLAIIQQHPRAKQQIEAVTLKHLDGLDDRAISQQLAVNIDSLYVLRARGLKKLRDDPLLRGYFDDL